MKTKVKLRTSREIYNLILWDNRLNQHVFVIGYIDRVAASGFREKPLIEWGRSDIPWSRVTYIRCGETIVWDRNERIDLFRDEKLPDLAWGNTNSFQIGSANFESKSVFHYQDGVWCYYGNQATPNHITDLKIVTWNILANDHDPEVVRLEERMPAILKNIEAHAPDVLVLEEVTSTFYEAFLQQQWVQQGYISESPGGLDNRAHGVIIWSKYDFKLVEHRYSRNKRFSIASWSSHGQEWHVAAMHLSSNRNINAPKIRKEQIQRVMEYVQNLKGVCFLVGDMNMGEEEGEDITFQFDLVDVWKQLHPQQEGFTFAPTENSLAAHASISGLDARLDRIWSYPEKDHFWEPKHIQVLGQGVIEGISPALPLSDHYGLVAQFEFIGEQQASKQEVSKVVEMAEESPFRHYPVHYKSGIVFIPPQAHWERIQAIRKQYDKKVDRWMPHITLIYGFIPDTAFEAVVEKIGEVLKNIQAFELTLEGYQTFSHHSSVTAWLQPSAKAQLAELQAALFALFPQCSEQSSKENGFTPHLSVGQFDSMIEMQRALPEWEAMTFEVGKIALISREDDTPFEVRYWIDLGTGAIQKEAINPSSLFALRKEVQQYFPSINAAEQERRTFALEIVTDACEGITNHKNGLHPIGSTAFGIASAGSDIDLVCLVPPTMKLATFFTALQESLTEIATQSSVVLEAIVPIAKFVIEGVEVDILCAKHPFFPMDIKRIKLGQQAHFEEVSWQALAGYWEAKQLKTMAKKTMRLSIFKEYLCVIRAWAKARQVHGGAWGYVGGYTWLVLAVWAARQHQAKGGAMNVGALLQTFFQELANHDWSEPIALSPEAATTKIRPKQDRMPVITTVAPYFNSARNITASTQQVLIQEWERAAQLVAKINQGKATWSQLFEKPDTTSNIRIAIPVNQTAIPEMISAIQGKVISLLIQLEHAGYRFRPIPHLNVEGKIIYLEGKIIQEGAGSWTDLIQAWVKEIN